MTSTTSSGTDIQNGNGMLTVTSGNTVTVVDGGSVASGTIKAGGTLVLASGTTATAITDAGVLDSEGITTLVVVDGGGVLSLVATPFMLNVESNGPSSDAQQVTSGAGTMIFGGTEDVGVSEIGADQFTTPEATDTGAVVQTGEQVVGAYGAAVDATVMMGGTQLVSSGGFADGTVLNGGDAIVSSGGTISGARVEGTGILTVSTGGTDEGSQVFAGGIIQVMSGGIDEGANVDANGTLTVFSAGNASNGTVSNGTIIASRGGIVSFETVSSGGVAIASSGGLLSGDVITQSGSATVLSGGSASGLTVALGGELTIADGGAASTTSLTDFYGNYYMLRPMLTVSSGGSASGLTVSSSDVIVQSGGTIKNVSLGESGEYIGTITPTGSSLTYVPDPAATLTVFGTTSGLTMSGANLTVGSGGVVSSASVSGGSATISAGGSIIGFTETGGLVSAVDGGALTLLANDAASGVSVGSGGILTVSSAASATFTVVASGGMLEIYGGAITDATVFDGGTEALVAGASVSDVVLSPDGLSVLDVLSGGVATSVTVGSGADLVVSSGGSATGNVLSGEQAVLPGASVDATSVGSGGLQTIAARATATNTVTVHGGTVRDDGTLVISMTGELTQAGQITGGGSLVLSGPGTLDLVSANSYAGGTTLSGGTLELDVQAAAGNGAITFAGQAELALDAGNQLDNVISGFAVGDSIDLETQGYAPTDTVQVTGDHIQVRTATSSQTVDIKGASNNSYALAAATDGSVLLEQNPCFAEGTRIATPGGDAAVEDLRPGDLVLVRGHGAGQPVTWVGRRRVDVMAHPQPAFVRPIRIRPHALAAGIPARTLRVSPDHALFLDGHLIQARQLVNGASIAVEHVPAVTYFHVELSQHGILFAEGAEAESYLDTGNRHQFESEAALSLHAVFERTVHPHACAPLVTDAVVVRPVWERLAARSEALGRALPTRPTTTEPMLHLVLPDGTVLVPRQDEARWTFVVGGRVAPGAPVHLVSRAASPSDLAAWRDDRRQLGVKVAALRAWAGFGDAAPATLPLGGPGWWGAEPDGCWTNGAATLLLPSGCVMLEVTIAATGCYPAEAAKVCRSA